MTIISSKLCGYGRVGRGHFSRIQGIFVYQDSIRHTVIHPNAGRLYDLLVVQSCYTNGTCRLPVLWCAGCIILSYTAMPAGCMIHWLYNHVIPMAHAVGRSNGVPAVSYWHTATPASCMIPWLYNHVIPMAHAVGLSYGAPAVSYCRTLQCLLVA